MKKILFLSVFFLCNFANAIDNDIQEHSRTILAQAMNIKIKDWPESDCAKLKAIMQQTPILWRTVSFQLTAEDIKTNFLKAATILSTMYANSTSQPIIDSYNLVTKLELENFPLYIRLSGEHLNNAQIVKAETPLNHPYLQANCLETIALPSGESIAVCDLPKKSERIININFYGNFQKIASLFGEIQHIVCNKTLGINPGDFLTTGITELERQKLTKPGIFFKNITLQNIKEKKQSLELYFIHYKALVQNTYKAFDSIYDWIKRVPKSERIKIAGGTEAANTQEKYVDDFIKAKNSIIYTIDQNFLNFEKLFNSFEQYYEQIQVNYKNVLQTANENGIFEGPNKSELLSAQLNNLRL